MSFHNCKIAGVGVNSDTYHSQAAKRGTPEYFMSPSSLKLFADCPSRYIAGYNPPDSDAKAWGSLLDTMLLTPIQLPERYVVRPSTYKDAKTGEEKPFNMNATVCKEWVAEQEGKEIITNKEYQDARAAVKRLKSDETIKSFLDASDTQVHVVGEWRDQKTGLIIPVQCLIDLVPRKDSEFQKSLGDLKSTRNAGLKPFSRWTYTAGYHIQAAFDLAMYQAAVNPNNDTSGEERIQWVFVIQENYAPFETGRRMLGNDFIEIGKHAYESALRKYAQCLKTGNWNGYDPEDEFTLILPEPWMAFEESSNMAELNYEEAIEESENTDKPDLIL